MIMIVIESHLYKTVKFRRMVISKVGFDRMSSFYKMSFEHEIDVTLGIVSFAIMYWKVLTLNSIFSAIS